MEECEEDCLLLWKCNVMSRDYEIPRKAALSGPHLLPPGKETWAYCSLLSFCKNARMLSKGIPNPWKPVILTFYTRAFEPDVSFSPSPLSLTLDLVLVFFLKL